MQIQQSQPTERNNHLIKKGSFVEWSDAPQWWNGSSAQVVEISGKKAYLDLWKDSVPLSSLSLALENSTKGNEVEEEPGLIDYAAAFTLDGKQYEGIIESERGTGSLKTLEIRVETRVHVVAIAQVHSLSKSSATKQAETIKVFACEPLIPLTLEDFPIGCKVKHTGGKTGEFHALYGLEGVVREHFGGDAVIHFSAQHSRSRCEVNEMILVPSL